MKGECPDRDLVETLQVTFDCVGFIMVLFRRIRLMQFIEISKRQCVCVFGIKALSIFQCERIRLLKIFVFKICFYLENSEENQTLNITLNSHMVSL